MTPVGLIPEDWNVIQLADYIVDINDGPFGSNLKSEHYTLDREVRIIQLGNVGDNGWNDENVKYTTFEHASTLKRCIVPYGTIIIAKMMPAGRAIICPSSEPAYIQGSDVIKVVFTDSIDKDFFIYLTKSKAYLEQIESGVQGSTRARTNIGKLKSLKLPLPSVEEQKRIAEALSAVDNMIATLDEAIAKKRQIKEGLMQQLLNGKTRLHGFSGEWVDIQLSQIGDMFAGGTPSTFNKEYWDGDICWLHSGAVQNCFVYPSNVQRKITSLGLQHSAARLIKADSVIVAITGATCANIGYLTFVSAANQSVVAIEPTAAYDSKFLYYKLLKSREQILSHKGGSAQSGVSLRSLSSVRIFIPADKKEQKAISDILLSIDAEIISLESKRDKNALIKQGMMQELLTGTIRLI